MKEKRTGFEQVKEFHETFNAPVLDTPTRPTPDRIRLRLSLILEEAWEVLEVIGSRTMPSSNIRQAMDDLMDAKYLIDTSTDEELDVIFSFSDMAKELTDLNVVTYGSGHEFGLNLDAAMEEVHRSNMSKCGPDGKPIYREDGKILKGPNYSPADMRPVLWPDVDPMAFERSNN